MSKTLLILADAFCGLYIDEYEMAFLSRFRDENLCARKIIPSFGFCERTEIFTGMRPQTSGNFTAIGFAPDQSPYHEMQRMLLFWRWLEKISYSNARRILRWYARKKEIMQPYNIPIASLGLFSLTEDRCKHDEFNAFVGESIFDILRRRGKTFSLEGFTQLGRKSRFLYDSERIDYAIKCMDKGDDFVPVYISIADTIGHVYRDSYEDMKRMAITLDGIVERIVSRAYENGYEIMFLGDHGMEHVQETVDVIAALKESNIIIHRDCEVFLDSTIARFWCANSNAMVKIQKCLEMKFRGKGTVITYDCFKQYGIPDGNSFGLINGDLIWCANTGVLIYPDYFNGSIDKGMHGYLQPTENGMGICICSSSKMGLQKAQLYDICPTLCDMLEITYPNRNEGKSLYNENVENG